MGHSTGSNHGNVTNTQAMVKHSHVKAREANVTQHPYNIMDITEI